MTGYAAAALVDALPRTGQPFGLFSVLTLRSSADERWINGIEWEAMTCEPVTGFDDPDCTTFGAGEGQTEKAFADFEVQGDARPFWVMGSAKCGTPGGRIDLRAEENATAHLLANEESQAESVVWSRMALEATDLHPAGALDYPAALAALEGWLGSVYGSQGVIHGSREAISILSRRVTQNGNRLTTKIGTPVVAGGGYPGTSPSPGEGAPGTVPAAGTTWLFASPAMFGYRGTPSTVSALDRGKNNFYAIAERPYVVGFDPCGVAAVRMNLA